MVTSTYYFILLKTTFDHFSNFLKVFFTPLLIVPPDFFRLDSHNFMRIYTAWRRCRTKKGLTFWLALSLTPCLGSSLRLAVLPLHPRDIVHLSGHSRATPRLGGYPKDRLRPLCVLRRVAERGWPSRVPIDRRDLCETPGSHIDLWCGESGRWGDRQRFCSDSG